MNIIPFVAIILIVLGTLSRSLGSKQASIEYAYLCFKGYMQAERSARNEHQARAFVRSNERKSKKTSSEQAPKKSAKNLEKQIRTEKLTFRELEQYSDRSKMNIFSLFQSHSTLKVYVEKVMTALYAPLIGEKEQISRLLKEMIRNGKRQLSKDPKKALTFLNLMPKEEKLNALYFKMLKGTRAIASDKGYPPIDDIFILDPSPRRKPLILDLASPRILAPIFGEKVAEKIIRDEKQIKEEKPKTKKTSITVVEFKQMLEDAHIFNYNALINDLLDTSSSKVLPSPKKIIGKDQGSSIQVFKRSY